MRLLAHFKANKLKENHFPLRRHFNFELDTSRFKVGGGSGLDVASNLVLSYFPAVHQEVERAGQAWWRSSKFLNFRRSNQKLKGLDKEGHFLSSF